MGGPGGANQHYVKQSKMHFLRNFDRFRRQILPVNAEICNTVLTNRHTKDFRESKFWCGGGALDFLILLEIQVVPKFVPKLVILFLK